MEERKMKTLKNFFKHLVRFSHQICFNTYKSCFIPGFFNMKGGFSMNESKKINSEIIDINGELLYTISEVAKLLKVNRNYVYALINGGYIRSIKLGCRKITRKALLEFLDKYDGIEFDENIIIKTE